MTDQPAPSTNGAVSTDNPWDDFGDGWHYRSNLALWFASVGGTVGKGNHTVDVDASFGDLLEKLELGAGLDFEVGKDPVSLLVFALYQRFQADADLPVFGFDADAEADLGLVGVALAYRFLDISADGAVAPRWNVSLAGTAGGFGVGSDFTWSLVGLIEYRPNPRVGLIMGYRVLDQDYENGSFVWDVTMHGPVVGLTIRW